ncbi:hypothetical protein D3C72_2364950 [compost metagenome]
MQQLRHRRRELEAELVMEQRLHQLRRLQRVLGEPGGRDGREEFPEAEAGKAAQREVDHGTRGG